MCCVWAEFVCVSDEHFSLCSQFFMHNAWTLGLDHISAWFKDFAYQYIHVSSDVKHNFLSFSIAFAQYLGNFSLSLWVIAFMLPGLSRRESLSFSHPTSTLIFRGPFFPSVHWELDFRHSNSHRLGTLQGLSTCSQIYKN